MEISPKSAYKWPFQSPTEWTTGRTLTLSALVMPKRPKKEAEAMIVQCRTNILNIRKDKTNISAHRCRWSTVYHSIGAIHCKTWYLILIVSIDKAANQSEKRNKSRKCQVALKNLKIESAKLSSCPDGELSWTSCVGFDVCLDHLQHSRALMDISYGPWQEQLWQLPSSKIDFSTTKLPEKTSRQCCISGLTNTTSHLSFRRNANVSATNLSSTRRAENISNIFKTWVSGSQLCTSNNFSNTIWEYLTQTHFHLFPILSTVTHFQ